ncbi:MAG: AAA family ATPase [Thiotrichaceae bacterium]|nr:AAA family ATPase [Thiotrichaceae bacterium]
MQATQALTSTELFDFLLNVAPIRPIFIWGAPGIGKSSLVEQFAFEVGLDCVSLLGSQLAPEDIIGVPQIIDGKSRFCPPTMIAREKPFCLFLDELNACSQEVQKAFYSLINDRRIGEYELPEGSIVIGAGNRAEDAAIVKPMSSALVNRMIHVSLRADSRSWLKWAEKSCLHELVISYIKLRPDHLWSKPPKHEEPFSTPRSWHMFSDCLLAYPKKELNEKAIQQLSSGLLTPRHAQQFIGYYKQHQYAYSINSILKGDERWPDKPEERDILYFMVQSFHAQLLKTLPKKHGNLTHEIAQLVVRSKDLLVQLSRISLEMAQLVMAEDEKGRTLPDWFMVEIARDLPRLLKA